MSGDEDAIEAPDIDTLKDLFGRLVDTLVRADEALEARVKSDSLTEDESVLLHDISVLRHDILERIMELEIASEDDGSDALSCSR